MNKRISTLFGIMLFGMICVAGYVAISDLVSSQSQQHQQSVSPIFGLIERELVEPLHIATTLDKIGVYREYFTQQEPDQDALIAQLKHYSTSLGLEFYVAHEKLRKQYNSDGRVFDLIEGQVIWYFALKDETDFPVQAVLGKRENVHLYIDVRQYDDNDNFIGFVGVGKSLDDFISSFDQFKSDYGHEFIFVNNRNEIVLSSKQEWLPTNSDSQDDVIGIKSITSLPWFDRFVSETEGQVEPSLVVASDDGDLLISQFSIASLNWSIYLLTPLSERQQEVNKSFAVYIGLGLLILFVVYKLVFSTVDYYADKMSRKFNYDQVTKLANVRYANLFFRRQRNKHRTMAVIILELDNIKQITDQHGHHSADLVLKETAQRLSTSVRKADLVVRWNTGKFVILAPNIEQSDALNLSEACRTVMLENHILGADLSLSVKGTIGLAYSRDLSHTLELMLEWAHQSIYRAKREGSNKVWLRESE